MKNMTKFYSIFMIVSCVFILSGIVKGDEPHRIRAGGKKTLSYKKDEIIVKYKDKSLPEKTFQAKSGFSSLKTYKRSGIKRLKITDGMDVEQALEIYNSDPDVEYAEPNYIYHIATTPNDTHFDKQWALENTGQTVNEESGSVDADIDATEAWDISTGNSDVVVAVIDSGVDYNHPDLSANIWINPGEIAGNGIDDDGNGKVDDVRGWDFVDSDNDPMDYNDHGTHVAGIIAAIGNNNTGVAGVAWSAKIMALRGLDTEGYGYTSDLIEAIDYASNNGADVINISWGGEDYSQALKDTIDSSPALIICSAGNESMNIDVNPLYPSSYDSSNIISVAASDQNDNLTNFSNYGPVSVDLAAPGENIYSSVPAREVIWSDNFDNGNMNGWTTGGTNNTWGVTASTYSTPSYSLAVNPYGFYKNDTDSWIKSPSIDLSSQKGARLDFNINGESESYYDVLYVQVSSDGRNWMDCDVITGTSQGNWIYYSIDLKDYEGESTVYIRFRFESDSLYNYKGFYIDDINVSSFSTSFIGTEYRFMDGTSMAAPYVSGAASLIKSIAPERSANQIKAAIMDSVDDKRKWKVASSGRLNIHNALIMATMECESISVNIPASSAEGDGILYSSGSVSILSPIEEDLVVYISSNDTSEIAVPSSVTIPAGETTVEFDITIIDDLLIDGTQTANITFSIPGCAVETWQIQVYDDDTTGNLTLDVPETATEGDDYLNRQGIVSSNVIVDTDITVFLSSSDSSKVTVPEMVTIPAGSSYARFIFTIVDDSINDQMQSITITGTATGWNTASDTILIADNDNMSWIEDSYSTELTSIIRDDTRNLLYLGDCGNRCLLVIDTETLEVILRLPVDSSFTDIAINKENSTMAISGGTLYLVDLKTFEKRLLPVDLDVVSAAFDHDGDLMLITSAVDDYIYHYDVETETMIQSFGHGSDLSGTIYKGGFLKTDESGNNLYVGDDASSPGSIYKFDISGDTPVFLVEEAHGDISVLRDFVISPQYEEIYISDSDLQIFDSNSLDPIQQLEMGAHAGGVATDTEGYYIFGLPVSYHNNYLYQFDSTHRELSFSYELLSEIYGDEPRKRGIAVDRSGKKAFIIHGNDDSDNPHYMLQVVELFMPWSLNLPDSIFEGDSTQQGRITMIPAPSDDLIIYLESDDVSEIQVPDSITLPAGQTSITFDISIPDDSILDGTKSVIVSASTPGYPPLLSTVDVNDNENATISLYMPGFASEGDGLLSDKGEVSLNSIAEDDITVMLSADKMGDVVFPKEVVIPAGLMSAAFDLYIVDDEKIEGNHNVTITAYVAGWQNDQKTIVITDNDSAELSVITTATFCEGDGVSSEAGLVTISGTLPYNLQVTLSLDDTTEITVPISVIIKARQTSAKFDITVVDDAQVDGLQSVCLTAQADGFPDVSYSVAVTDNDNTTWMDETFSTYLSYIIRDDIRNLIYLGDAGNGHLVIINTLSNEVVMRVPITSTFKDMAISKDNSTLVVAGGTLVLVDLDSYETRELSVDLDIVSAAFDYKNDLMLLTSDVQGYIYHYDADTETIIRSFGSGSDLTVAINPGLLKTDENGNILYVAGTYGSPGSIYKFDISMDTPVFIVEDDHGDIHGINDFYISPIVDEIYNPGGNIQVINSSTIEAIEEIDIDIPIWEADLDVDGFYLLSAGSTFLHNTLYQFDIKRRKLLFHYNLDSEVEDGSVVTRGVTVDRTGKRAYIIHGDSYPSPQYKIQVVELNSFLTLYIPESVSEGDGILANQGVITLMNPAEEDLIITLISNNPNEIQVPDTVTISAGERSATFNLTVIDDSILDGGKPIEIRAVTSGYNSYTGIIKSNDNETAILTLTLPESVSEGDDILTGQGTISVDRPVEGDVLVYLKADNTGEVFFPSVVTIPSGETSVLFDLTVMDDNEIDGVQPVTLTASVGGWGESQATISVIDNEQSKITIDMPNFSEGDGMEGGCELSISGALPYDLEINLASNDTTEITVPATVTIPAWETSVFFIVTVQDDDEKDGPQSVTITASSDGFTDGVLEVVITDNENITWIDGTLSKDLTYILRDNVRDNIYLADAGNRQLVVIDSESLEIVLRLSLDNDFLDMSISKDNNTLAIAGRTLFLLNLETYEIKQLHPDLYVASVAFDQNGKLMLLTSEEGYIYHYDPETDTVIKTFGTGIDLNGIIYQNSLLKTDFDGKYLYVVDNSSFSTYKFDISNDNILYLEGGDDGGVDFSISPIYDEIYVAKSIPYGIHIIDSNTLEFIQLLETEAFPIGVTTDLEGHYVYGLHYTASIYKNLFQFNVTTRALEYSYDLQTEIHNGSPRERGIAIDRSGKQAFIIHGGDYYDSDYYKVQVVELVTSFDSDDDGLSDEVEETSCTNPHDADSDDDGILDGIEDSNHNGIVDAGETDPCDADSDDDYIQDGTELGYVAGHSTDTDTGIFQPDLDNSTTTDPLNADSDNDDIDDGEEDVNYNGRVDAGESNPDLFDNPLTNHPPVATAGAVQNIDEGAVVTLNGSNSYDPDGNIDSYEWTQVGEQTVELSDPTAVLPTFTAPDVSPGGLSLTFKLKVIDVLGLFSEDTCIVNISWLNEAPVADAGETQTVYEGDDVFLDGSNSYDVDDGIASYSWIQIGGMGVTLTDATSMNPSFATPDVGTGGAALTFELTVTDNWGLQHTDTCIVNISWVNTPPVANAGVNETVTEGETVTLNGASSSDPDDGIASYLWEQTAGSDVTFSDPTDTLPTFVTPPVSAAGETLTFKLTATDNGGLKSEDTVSVTINDNGISAFPESVLSFSTSTNQDAGCEIEEGGAIVALDIIDPSMITNAQNRPENLIYGLMDFTFKTDVTGGTVKVTIYLPSPAPAGYKWYKYSSTDGWIDYSSHTSFNAARDQVTLTLTDGGTGDDDKVANGIIVDPSGLGSAPSAPVNPPDNPDPPSTGGGGGGGGSGIFGTIDLSELTGYHLDWTEKDGTAVYMPVTDWIKALKGAQTHVEGFAPGLAVFVRESFDALETKAKSDQDGLLSKTGTYLFPVFGKIAEIYLDAVNSHELMDNAYLKTTISVDEFNRLNTQGGAVSSHVVKENSN